MCSGTRTPACARSSYARSFADASSMETGSAKGVRCPRTCTAETVAGELEQSRRRLGERRADRGRCLLPHPAGERLTTRRHRFPELPVGSPASEAVCDAELANQRCARPRKVELLRQARSRSHRAASVAAGPRVFRESAPPIRFGWTFARMRSAPPASDNARIEPEATSMSSEARAASAARFSLPVSAPAARQDGVRRHRLRHLCRMGVARRRLRARGVAARRPPTARALVYGVRIRRRPSTAVDPAASARPVRPLCGVELSVHPLGAGSSGRAGRRQPNTRLLARIRALHRPRTFRTVG